MKKLLSVTIIITTILLSGCADINNTPIEPNDEVTEPINYVEEATYNYSGTIKSIEGNLIELEDGTIIDVTKNIIDQGVFVTLIVKQGPSDFEFIITEVKYQASLMINPGTNELEVSLVDGVAEVSGNISTLQGNLLQILDKRFILNEDTVFDVTVDEGDSLVSNLLISYEVGDNIRGYGLLDLNNNIVKGTITEFSPSE